MKILLVEFQDVHCRKDQGGRLPRYTSKDFEDMLGSMGIYASPAMHSPDGDPVVGSMNDYYRAMSGGRMNIHAFVINPIDRATGLPIWIRLRSDKGHYEKETENAIFLESQALARGLGLDVTTSDDTKLAVIYAGNTYYTRGGLNPVARDHRYLMSELQGTPYSQEHQDARFSRIGLHCHEFAHTIGIGHSSGSRADLMCSGTRNGSVVGNMPAPLNAIARMRAGWATVIPVDSLGGRDVDVSYALTAPVIYRMTNRNGDYFLVENRRFDQTMMIGETEVPDYNHASVFPPAGPHGTITQGIFVWRVNAAGDVKDPGYSTEGLIYASGRYGRTYPENIPSETDDGVPFPGVSNTRILSPWSDPRNPYTKESDYPGSSTRHYTLYVPNTKGVSTCGMEILSEDREHGTFRVRFSNTMAPTALLENAQHPDSLGVSESQRTVCRDSNGIVHHVVEVGGEVFYRNWVPGSDRPQGLSSPLSNGNGGNGAPSITLAGPAIMVVWQVQASGADNYVIHTRRSIDQGDSWSELTSAGFARGCTPSGPRPSVAGLDDGRAMITYCTSSSLLASLSGDGGLSWHSPAKALAFPKISDDPSVHITMTSHGIDGNVVFCADSAGHAQVYCAAFCFQMGSWHSPWNVSCVLPSQYAGFHRPGFLLQSTHGGRVPWIVWDAVDDLAGGEQVIACRELLPGAAGPSFRILRGRFRNNLDLGDLDEITNGKADHESPILASFSLHQNYPNPFNPRTVVSSQLPVASDVTLVVYDVLGKEVVTLVNERREAGVYRDVFDAAGLASGVYIYRLTAGSFVQSRTMLLLK